MWRLRQPMWQMAWKTRPSEEPPRPQPMAQQVWGPSHRRPRWPWTQQKPQPLKLQAGARHLAGKHGPSRKPLEQAPRPLGLSPPPWEQGLRLRAKTVGHHRFAIFAATNWQLSPRPPKTPNLWPRQRRRTSMACWVAWPWLADATKPPDRGPLGMALLALGPHHRCGSPYQDRPPKAWPLFWQRFHGWPRCKKARSRPSPIAGFGRWTNWLAWRGP